MLGKVGSYMKLKKLIALLLCLVTVMGTIPMSIGAEETATADETEYSFNEMFDFNSMTTSTTANAASIGTMISDTSMFSTSFFNGTSGLSYVDKDGNGDMALKLTNTHGFLLNDTKLALLKTPFVLEYDVRFEKIGGNSNTVQFIGGTNSSDEKRTALMPTKIDTNVGNVTYATEQNLSSFKYPTTGYSSNLPVDSNTWYHYAFYIDTVKNTVSAYRDGICIWTATLGAFPATSTYDYIRFYSGNTNTIAYFDNIHIQSLRDKRFNGVLDFENATFGTDETSQTATPAILNNDFGYENMFNVTANDTYTKIIKDGESNYLEISSNGVKFANGGNLFINDLSDRLGYQSWTVSFDWYSAGTKDANDAEVKFSTVDQTLLAIRGSSASGLFVVNSDGQVRKPTSNSGSGVYLSPKTWYKIIVDYDVTTKTCNMRILGNGMKDKGGNSLGSSVKFDPFTLDVAALGYTHFRFGYNWDTNMYFKYYLDNIAFTSSDKLDITLDFEEGKNGVDFSPSNASIGGAYTYSAINGQAFTKELPTSYASKFKYVDDANGNTFLGSYVGHEGSFINIYDTTLYTLSKKFVMSFDFMINEKTTTYTMATWRTSKVNVPLWIIQTTTDGKAYLRIKTNLTGSSYAQNTPYLTSGTWYNFATIIDPVEKTAEFYMGGLDTEPIYKTTFTHDISAAEWSSFSIGPGSNTLSDGNNDYIGYDNIRIYTIDETVESTETDVNMSVLPVNGVIVESDFEGFAAGTAMSSQVWNTIAPFGVNATDGIVVEANGNKHFQPVSGSGATSFNISSYKSSPYLDGVIAIESDFTLSDNSANSGNLVIAALKRVGTDGKTVNAPLLTADNNGKLTVATHSIDYTLPTEAVRIRLELSYFFHTVNLYVNGDAIATGIPLKVDTTLTTSPSYFTDGLGNTYNFPFTGYGYYYAFDGKGIQIKDQNGKKTVIPHYYENYGFAASLSYIKDSIEMFGASADEAWSFAMDNLKIYLDKDADIYYNGFDSWDSEVVAKNTSSDSAPTTVASPFSQSNAKFIDDNGNRVLSTVSDTSESYNAAFFIKDHNSVLNGKTFVLEFDIKYNPDFELLSFSTNSTAILTTLTWQHMLRLYPDGGYEVNSNNDGSSVDYFKANDWSRVQVVFSPNASGESHTGRFYVDGVLVSKTAGCSLLNTLRIGVEANSYDAKFDNIRIYISDKPDAYEPVIKGSLEGKSLLSLEVSKRDSLEKLMANNKNGVVWNFKKFNTTVKNINGSYVNVLLDKGDFVRVVHNQITNTTPFNIFVNKATLEGHKQYVFETEIRYTCPTGFELEVISVFDSATQSKDKLVYILGTSREIVFNRNGFTYSLTDADGNKLYAEDVTADATKFTKIAVIVDEKAGNYSVYVNDRVAYYNYGGDIITATEIDIDKTPVFEPSGLVSQTTSNISLLNMSTSTSSDAFLDIKSANLYVLRNGVAPCVVSTQSKIEALECDVRFIAPIDMLYGTEVGFDVLIDSSESYDVIRSSNTVYSSIKAFDQEKNEERDFTADELGGTFLALITVKGVPVVDTVTYTVTPFVIIGDSKIYNESFTVTYKDGKVVTE